MVPPQRCLRPSIPNAPLSAERADRLSIELAGAAHRTVIDLGCGWGELLLRILALQPDARGIGVETHGPDIARAQDNASARGLSERVEFIEGAAVENLSAADVVINIRAFQAFGNVRDALGALRPLVKPGGRLLFGTEYWEHPPTAVQLANIWPGIAAEDNTQYLADRPS